MRLVSKRLLSIDWDAKNLRLALVRPHADRVELLKAVSVPIPPDVRLDDAESLGAFLREAMRQAKVSARCALMSVPREQVVINTMTLPPTPSEELSAIVQFQIVKELPFAADQAVVDFAVSGDFDVKEPCTLLVAAVRNEDLAFHRKVAHEAGLVVERIGLRPHANLVAVSTKAPELRTRTVLLVEIGPQLTEIDVLRNGTLVFSRAASVALPDYGAGSGERLDDSRIVSAALRDREPSDVDRRAVGNLMVEIIRSYEAHRATDPGVNVEQIIVCGASGFEAPLAEVLAARFGTEAGLYMPDRALDLPPQRAKELRGFGAVLGLAIGHSHRGLRTFDFLHPKKPVSKRQVRLKKMPIAVATGLFFIGAGVASYANFVYPRTQDVAALENTVFPKRKDAKTVAEFAEKVQALEDWQASEEYWPELLAALTVAFPSEEEACVTRADFESKTRRRSAGRVSTATIRMRTASMGKVHDFSAKLRDLGFVDVKTGKETPIAGRIGAGIYNYETSVQAELPLRVELRKKRQELYGVAPDEDSAGDAADEPRAPKLDSNVHREPLPAAPATDESSSTPDESARADDGSTPAPDEAAGTEQDESTPANGELTPLSDESLGAPEGAATAHDGSMPEQPEQPEQLEQDESTPANGELTPAPGRSSPAREGPSPAPRRSTPAHNETAPARNELTPAPGGSSPVRERPAPVPRRSTPAHGRPTHGQDESPPVLDEPPPILDGSAPVLDGSRPVSDRAASVPNESPAADNESKPANDGSAPEQTEKDELAPANGELPSAPNGPLAAPKGGKSAHGRPAPDQGESASAHDASATAPDESSPVPADSTSAPDKSAPSDDALTPAGAGSGPAADPAAAGEGGDASSGTGTGETGMHEGGESEAAPPEAGDAEEEAGAEGTGDAEEANGAEGSSEAEGVADAEGAGGAEGTGEAEEASEAGEANEAGEGGDVEEAGEAGGAEETEEAGEEEASADSDEADETAEEEQPAESSEASETEGDETGDPS